MNLWHLYILASSTLKIIYLAPTQHIYQLECICLNSESHQFEVISIRQIPPEYTPPPPSLCRNVFPMNPHRVTHAVPGVSHSYSHFIAPVCTLNPSHHIAYHASTITCSPSIALHFHFSIYGQYDNPRWSSYNQILSKEKEKIPD